MNFGPNHGMMLNELILFQTLNPGDAGVWLIKDAFNAKVAEYNAQNTTVTRLPSFASFQKDPHSNHGLGMGSLVWFQPPGSTTGEWLKPDEFDARNAASEAGSTNLAQIVPASSYTTAEASTIPVSHSQAVGMVAPAGAPGTREYYAALRTQTQGTVSDFVAKATHNSEFRDLRAPSHPEFEPHNAIGGCPVCKRRGIHDITDLFAVQRQDFVVDCKYQHCREKYIAPGVSVVACAGTQSPTTCDTVYHWVCYFQLCNETR
ncbi:hypothetical protein BJ508DRAFT_334828 [Ascobolus immersus RN42]|uniref:Uncharacterized protein n=1 Tax=Ascobolus immersus RN42 TaxID=1160509 RepID=A0A3N4HJ74_ASCIM|nr:hypothetical protein BJ508DRAFT_334828 [Ascobolus immersus RN42]